MIKLRAKKSVKLSDYFTSFSLLGNSYYELGVCDQFDIECGPFKLYHFNYIDVTIQFFDIRNFKGYYISDYFYTLEESREKIINDILN